MSNLDIWLLAALAAFFVFALGIRIAEGVAYYRLKRAEADLRAMLDDLRLPTVEKFKIYQEQQLKDWTE